MLRTSFTAFSRFRTPRFPARASRRRPRVRGASAEVLESRLMLSGATLWVDHATPSASGIERSWGDEGDRFERQEAAARLQAGMIAL